MFIVSGTETLFATVAEAEVSAKNASLNGGKIYIAEIVGTVTAVESAPTYDVKNADDKLVETLAAPLP